VSLVASYMRSLLNFSGIGVTYDAPSSHISSSSAMAVLVEPLPSPGCARDARQQAADRSSRARVRGRYAPRLAMSPNGGTGVLGQQTVAHAFAALREGRPASEAKGETLGTWGGGGGGEGCRRLWEVGVAQRRCARPGFLFPYKHPCTPALLCLQRLQSLSLGQTASLCALWRSGLSVFTWVCPRPGHSVQEVAVGSAVQGTAGLALLPLSAECLCTLCKASRGGAGEQGMTQRRSSGLELQSSVPSGSQRERGK